MKVSENMYKAMPPELRAVFRKLPNPGSEEVVGMFPATISGGTSSKNKAGSSSIFGRGRGLLKDLNSIFRNSGSAARFFYSAKASKKDRGVGNSHPTVKPTALMRYLCKLVTPPGGTILDPFMGSGSTGKAAMLEGFKFIGIEKEEQYFDIACNRLKGELNKGVKQGELCFDEDGEIEEECEE